MGGGTNFLQNFGVVTGSIFLSAGDADTLTNNRGSIYGDINLGGGDNKLRNYGDISGKIIFGNGADLLINRGGAIYGDIAMGSNGLSISGDKVLNRSLIVGNITFGTFNDVFDNRGGTVDGMVSMGDGDDVFDNRAGTLFGPIKLEQGADTYILGSGAQDVDGGTGPDRLDFSRAGAITFDVGTTEGQSGLPTDSVFRNFESVVGSLTGINILTGAAGTNEFFGGRASDTLSGGADSDVLVGNGGNDILLGGTGDDALSGGAGNDRLTGGAGTDTLSGGLDKDTFVFADIERVDFIFDFNKIAKDRIDLSAIDANPVLPGDQAFKFIGAAIFTNLAGELRFRPAIGSDGGNTTVVDGDVNGDGVADFSVTLIGMISLLAADFVL